jgi:glucose/arabinose dehydrogenase
MKVREIALVVVMALPLSACSAEAAGPAVVATGLEVPWDMAFLPDGSALLTERPGRVRLLTAAGRLRSEPIAEIEVEQDYPAELRGNAMTAGLLGIAVDPAFVENRYVYLYRSTLRANQVVRYRYADDELVEERVIVDGIPPSADHVGGRLRFGPDGWLYLSTGYLTDENWPQDANSLAGKVLRLPLAAARGAGGRPEVYASGFRNPQGLEWLATGELVATEHGASARDELNLVVRGGNYGWPVVDGSQPRTGMRPPLVEWVESVAPSGVTRVRVPGSAWTGSLLVATLKGESLRRIVVTGGRVTEDRPEVVGEYGRIRLACEAPDGSIYLLVSNRHLGSPREGDDRLVRLRPPPTAR